MDIVIISNDKKSKEILKQHILEIDSTANISLFNENIDLKHELTHFNKHTIFFIYLREPFSNGILLQRQLCIISLKLLLSLFLHHFKHQGIFMMSITVILFTNLI